MISKSTPNFHGLSCFSFISHFPFSSHFLPGAPFPIQLLCPTLISFPIIWCLHFDLLIQQLLETIEWELWSNQGLLQMSNLASDPSVTLVLPWEQLHKPLTAWSDASSPLVLVSFTLARHTWACSHHGSAVFIQMLALNRKEIAFESLLLFPADTKEVRSLQSVLQSTLGVPCGLPHGLPRPWSPLQVKLRDGPPLCLVATQGDD